MNAERIDKVRRRAEAGLKNCSFDEARQFYTDVLVLLALLDEKAEKMKVGEDKAVKLTGGLTIAPVAETSPGSPEDERAFAALWDLIEHALKQSGDYFTEMTDAAFKAHWHLRRRLAAGTPLHGDVMCEVCGAIGHLRPAPIVDSSADIPKPAPPEDDDGMKPYYDFSKGKRGALVKKPAPPTGTTDGTLTFKMPQATTASPDEDEAENPYLLSGAELERTEAEVELDKMLIADLTKDMNEYHDKAEIAEAELARWSPLIEAAGRVDKVGVLSYYDDTMRLVYGIRQIPEDNWDYVIRALLAAIPERDK